MWNWFKKEIKLEAGKYYDVEDDNVKIKPLGNGEFHIECMGNIVRFNIHAMLMQEYINRFVKPLAEEYSPLLIKTDKELKAILKEIDSQAFDRALEKKDQNKTFLAIQDPKYIKKEKAKTE